MRWHIVFRRWRLGASFIKGVLLVAAGFVILSLAAVGLPRLSLPSMSVPVIAGGDRDVPGQGLLSRLIEIYEIDFVRVLEQGLPLYTRHQFRGTKATGSAFSWIKSGSNKLWVSLQPLELLQSELGRFKLAARGENRLNKTDEPNEIPPLDGLGESRPPLAEPKEVLQPTIKPDGPPRIAIYHTHTSEDYVPTSGKSHTYDREAGIVAVGRELVQKLEEKHGIRCVHDTSVHDADVFREAYLRSSKTVSKLIKENPQLEVILDIHRDAPTNDNTKSRSITTAEIDSKQVGRIYLIVGTDRLGLPHPKWQENHAFAMELQRQLEALYPGLSRGIKIDTARFNQHLHSRLLLIEIGGEQNTLEEAKLAAGYLADALAAWFRNQAGAGS